ncbi:cytochrome P450 [Bombardia bombarda]|uniref:Cytochrome P450 n=1 Tax=Bombardia bombarda TaxID=252184 RepID=A0AA40C8M5_9PEZI|nr:cytochrome P450 [Bombardia bombarda]
MAAELAMVVEDSFSLWRAALAIVFFTIVSFLVDFTWKPRYGKSLPRVGYGDGVLATVRNWIGYMVHYNDWVADGYERYSKHNRAFVVPSAPSRPSEIVVPRSQAAWMLELPDRVLSTSQAHNDVLYNDYQFFGTDDQFPIRTMHKHLARNLPALIPQIQHEIHASIDAVFGSNTEEWTTLNLWDAWLAIVPRVTNTILVGAPTCRHKGFLASQVAFLDCVVRNSFILNMFPRVLHPIVGRLVVAPNWWHLWKTYHVLKPVIEQRLHDYDSDTHKNLTPDNQNLITWLIHQAHTEGLTHELTPWMISQRLLPIEFAAIHTTAITGHALLLDLLTSDPSLGYLDALRDETSQVFASENVNGSWTKAALSQLHRTDSAIRESMRLSHFATALTHRKPERYDAWRFFRVREGFEARQRDQAHGDGDKERDMEEMMRIKRLGMVTTSDAHLSFGHGRHACPGRFFVAHELKIMLAYLLQNYDIKPLSERPKPMWIGQTIVPPLQATIEVRRRKRV